MHVHDGKGEEVLLVFPGKTNSTNPQVPLSLLHLAAYLKASGFRPRILDMRVERLSESSIGNPLLVGISSMSGHQIRYGLRAAETVKERNPSVPIIWGGVHPTLLPEQTAASPLVDIVVRGEGEVTLVDLADTIRKGKPLDSVAGITYKEGGVVHSTSDRPPLDMDSIPVDLPFDLIDAERYPSMKAGRFHIQTSRGCPHRCGFCYNSIFNKRGWRGKSPPRVLDEFENVTEKYPSIKCLDIIDDNFFVDRKRVEEICIGMAERGIDASWRADCRFDYMAGYTPEFISLLEKSRCTELNFGAETGSPRLLELIHKDISTEMMYRSAEKLRQYAPGIEPYVFWMSGLPTEKKTDLEETYKVQEKLSEINPRTQHIEICVFTPFPSPLYEEFAKNYDLPTSLEEWGDVDVFHYRPPWHDKSYVDMLESISVVTKYNFYPEARIAEMRQPIRAGYKVMHTLAKYRWNHKYFGFPVELRLASAAARVLRGY